ncbi:holo-ACP synthase [Halobacillus halophilus]|uniref:holo-ACP synthase n=1 Tax=Halobacillus halophilus TaxID=1570 RepID=UPI001CD1E94D|nr:holo-ACP synthase [Halobacillus halophilus]MCA1012935.1 holo-ACP synthase [Halobacillus halophilus]
MIRGIGIDIIEMDRIKQSIKRKPRFIQRILTDGEYQRFKELNERRQTEYAAGRFAAKEALAKSLGTGIGALSFQHIEVLSNGKGAPSMKVQGFENLHIWLSISHSTTHAVAQVVLEER